jgi:hypothetical protein
MGSPGPEVQGLIPTFAQPRTPVLDPPLVEDENQPEPASPSVEGADVAPSRRLRLPGLRRAAADDDTRTGTSSPDSERPAPSKAEVKLTGELVAAVLGLAFLGGAALVRMRRGRRLRQPSRKHLNDMGAPLGRIAARHVPVEWLNEDLVDGLEFGSAVAVWANDGPLTVPDKPDPGLPADLQEEPQQ